MVNSKHISNGKLALRRAAKWNHVSPDLAAVVSNPSPPTTRILKTGSEALMERQRAGRQYFSGIQVGGRVQFNQHLIKISFCSVDCGQLSRIILKYVNQRRFTMEFGKNTNKQTSAIPWELSKIGNYFTPSLHQMCLGSVSAAVRKLIGFNSIQCVCLHWLRVWCVSGPSQLRQYGTLWDFSKEPVAHDRKSEAETK